MSNEYSVRIKSVLESLQIPPELVASRTLSLHPEAEELVVVEIGRDGREHRLISAAAAAWKAMRAAACADGLSLEIVSAFRNVDRQAQIVREKLERGFSLQDILSVSAPPGYSEHHTGRAVDITDGASPLEADFERTTEFRWLCKNAGSFSFFLSFPRGNPHGYAYEPWHWCFRQSTV